MPKLRKFQRRDVRRIKKSGLRALIASAPGTGKTCTAIRAFYETHKRSLPALVLCPASVTENWAEEIQTWAKGVYVVIIDDMESRIPRTRRHNVIYVMSWALLDTRLDEIKRLPLRGIIGDEVHYCKNPDAKRTMAMQELCKKVRHVLLLSGTPIVNNSGELRVIKSLLGKKKPLMIRRLLEDVAPEIPEKKRTYLPVKLRKKYRKEYDKAVDDFEGWLRREKEKLLGQGKAEYEVERILAAEGLAKVGYLRRLVGRFKVPAAVDWVSRAVRMGEQVIVFCDHQDVLKRLRHGFKKLRLRHVVIQGSTSSKRRQRAVEDFQAGKYPIFIGTRAAKEGITLTAARHVLFVERFFTSADEEQAEDRARRIGQRRKTTIWYLHAQDTIDDRLDEIVQHKRRLITKAIGLSVVPETETSSVVSLLKDWNKSVKGKGKPLSLGLGKPLAPLPRPKNTFSIYFSTKKWTPKKALLWCRMHGFDPERFEKMADRLKFIQHPAEAFHHGSFESVTISRSVHIIVGKRLKGDMEYRSRRNLPFYSS